jgi:DNA-3-methyladenine glycosylase
MPNGPAKRSAAPTRARRSVRSALPTDFFLRPADEVARDLLGCRVRSHVDGRPCGGEIVETEAYTGPEDEASHAHVRFGRTARNSVMFGPPGLAYVYLIYGMHWCLNAVTGPGDFPAAVLIRAARPVEGIDTARERRPGRPDRDLMRGPGNLCRALGVTGVLNGHPLDESPLWIEAGAAIPDDAVARGPRVGISRAVEEPLRFWADGSRWVSGASRRL